MFVIARLAHDFPTGRCELLGFAVIFNRASMSRSHRQESFRLGGCARSRGAPVIDGRAAQEEKAMSNRNDNVEMYVHII